MTNCKGLKYGILRHDARLIPPPALLLRLDVHGVAVLDAQASGRVIGLDAVVVEGEDELRLVNLELGAH